MCDCVECKNEECKCEDVKVETTVEGNAEEAVHIDTQSEMQSAKETKPEERAKGRRGRKPKNKEPVVVPDEDCASYKEEKTCCAPCNPPCDGVAVSKGLCSAHYMRQRKGMPIDVPIVRNAHKPVKRCSAPCDPPCEMKAVMKGLCGGHYQRLKSGRLLTTPIMPTKARRKKFLEEGRLEEFSEAWPVKEGERKKKPGKICCYPCDPPCEMKAVAHGLCYAHYARRRRGSQKDGPVRKILHEVTEEKQELAPVLEGNYPDEYTSAI